MTIAATVLWPSTVHELIIYGIVEDSSSLLYCTLYTRSINLLLALRTEDASNSVQYVLYNPFSMQVQQLHHPVKY